MKIRDVKINGVRNPVGFDLSHVTCSWKVDDARGMQQANAEILVKADEDVVLQKSGMLNSLGEPLELPLQPRTRYDVTVTVTDETGDTGRSEGSYFETGKLSEPWTARFLTTAPEDTFHPVFFRDFPLSGRLKSAKLHVTGLGLYEASLNGEKIGNEFLSPFCNDYRSAIQVQTYDVTGLLQGDNRLEITLGNGWYKGRLGYEGGREFFGNRFKCIAELHLRYADGREEVLGTDERWQYRPSDVVESDLYDGEVLDRQQRPQSVRPAVLDTSDDLQKLTDRYSLPLVVKQRLPVREVLRTPAGETVLDLGQNFAGFLEFRAKLPAGTRITLDHGEILQNGCFYNDNYRSAKARFVYVSDGREELVHPRFTFFGFRYVRVMGWPGAPEPADFRGCVLYSDMDDTLTLESSDPKLNRLQQNALWGQRSNFLDMPTDCPQRDERLGWTGDAQVFAPTACYQMDTRCFYEKFLRDLRVEQLRQNGAVPNYLPNLGGLPSGSSVWGDVATFLPMTLYQAYGDLSILRRHYSLMQDWVEWIIRGDEANGNRHLWSFGFHFGDWLALDGITEQSMKGGTEDAYVASMYYYASLQKTARAAMLLGFAEDKARYTAQAALVREAILHEYFTPAGRLAVDTQTGYLLALRFGVYRDKKVILDGLKARLKKDCYRIRGGFVGATTMCRVLAENGLENEAAFFLFQPNFPGWMHCVDLGATTIWERWNSVLDDGSISGTGMNSLNHYAYGSVMEYVYRDLAGIQAAAPGYRSIRFAPQPTSRLRHLQVSYDSASGTVVSAWRINPDGSLTLRFTVPFGTSATAILPGTGGKVLSLEPGTAELTYMPDVDYRKKYSLQTRLGELRGDSEAMALLREDFPQAWQLAVSGDRENENLSFEELQTMFFFGFNPGLVQNGTRRLFNLMTKEDG